MSNNTPVLKIDKRALETAKREALHRLHLTRETLASQLYAASWAVQEAATAALEGDVIRAQAAAQRASELTYAVTESTADVDSILSILGVSNA